MTSALNDRKVVDIFPVPPIPDLLAMARLPQVPPLSKNNASCHSAPSALTATIYDGPSTAPAEAPDGGWGWVVTCSCFFMHLIVLGSIYSFGVFLPVYIIEFKQGRGEVSWVGSVGAAGFVAFALPTTFIVQRLGARATSIVGSVLVGGGLLIASFSTELWHLYVTQGIIVGFGYAFIMLPSLALVNVYFKNRRGLAVGLAASGSGIGQMVIAPWTAQLLAVYGWRSTLQINSAIFFAVSFLASLSLVPCPGAPATHPDIFVGARRNKRGFAVLVIGFDFCMFGFLFPFIHLPQYATLYGVSASNSALLLTIMGASSAAGRVMFGFFADNIGRLAAFKVSVVLSSLSVFFWLLCGDNFGMMAAFSVLYGVFGGSVLGLLTVAVAEVVGVVYCLLLLITSNLLIFSRSDRHRTQHVSCVHLHEYTLLAFCARGWLDCGCNRSLLAQYCVVRSRRCCTLIYASPADIFEQHRLYF
jgi:MFS family permease